MEYDIEKLTNDYLDIAIDASYVSNLKKHLPTIKSNLKIISSYLLENKHNPDSADADKLMKIGYWLYFYRDYYLKFQSDGAQQ